MTSSTDSEIAIGFYTVEYSETLGWTGGYLLLNAGGRPMEFHCTLPVRPSRTHEILYGAKLRSYLIGEAIAEAILNRAKLRASLICVDQIEAVRLREIADCPSVFLGKTDREAAASARASIERSLRVSVLDRGPTTDDAEETVRQETLRWKRILWEGQGFECIEPEEARVRELLAKADSLSDWQEPFARIREAIREAQQGATGRGVAA